MKTQNFKAELITGTAKGTILLMINDEFSGEVQREIDAYVQWEYATKPSELTTYQNAYMESEIRYNPYIRKDGLWTKVADKNMLQQLSGAFEPLMKKAEKLAKESMKERNLREKRIPEPTIIPDFLDKARAL